jgi:hypothetical protein
LPVVQVPASEALAALGQLSPLSIPSPSLSAAKQYCAIKTTDVTITINKVNTVFYKAFFIFNSPFCRLIEAIESDD